MFRIHEFPKLSRHHRSVDLCNCTAYAFAASNTLADAGKAGDGSNTVSGYIVTGVTYNLSGANYRIGRI